MSDEKDLEWGTPTESDIFAETTAMPIQPDIFKETDAMPLDMEKEKARKEANAKSEEISSSVEADSDEVEDIERYLCIKTLYDTEIGISTHLCKTKNKSQNTTLSAQYYRTDSKDTT